MPATEAALAAGTLSVAKARLLAGAINERTAERFAEQEAFLIEQVQALPVDDAKTALDYWRRLADTDGPDPDDPTRNWARLLPGYGGRWHLEADLDPVAGTILKAVLDAIGERMHQEGRFKDLSPEANSASHRDAGALIEMARRASGSDPDRQAVHPDVVVVVPVAALTSGVPDPFNPPLVRDGGPVSLDTVLRLAQLGTVSAMTTDAAGRPLRLGRKQRLASGDQWTALAVRDGGCVAPGCDRPVAFCQAHHLSWWDRDGGATDLENLALLCSHHHHLIHDQKWTLQAGANNTWQLLRPDGAPVDHPRYVGHRPMNRARSPA